MILNINGIKNVLLLITLIQKHKTMLEYAKTILPKVSFSRELFKKELNKCIAWLDKEQVKELYVWCNENFKGKYPKILSEAFAGIAA